MRGCSIGGGEESELGGASFHLQLYRMEVPRSTVTWTKELERRQTARQAEPGGMEEMWWEGYIFINNKIVIASILTFSEAWGTLDQMSRTLCF